MCGLWFWDFSDYYKYVKIPTATSYCVLKTIAELADEANTSMQHPRSGRDSIGTVKHTYLVK